MRIESISLLGCRELAQVDWQTLSPRLATVVGPNPQSSALRDSLSLLFASFSPTLFFFYAFLTALFHVFAAHLQQPVPRVLLPICYQGESTQLLLPSVDLLLIPESLV